MSFGLDQRELEVQVGLPTTVLMLVSHPTDYLTRTHFLADGLPFDRCCIEIPLEGPERNATEQVRGDHHITVSPSAGL